jgi:hypothetical protein
MESLSRSCSVEGCQGEYLCKGFCGLHYRRARKGHDLEAPLFQVGANTPRGCVVDGCDRKHEARGYCQLHYRRSSSTTKTPIAKIPMDAPIRMVKPGRICGVEGCENPHEARDYCVYHYNKAKDNGEFPDLEKCQVEGCERNVRSRGYCASHYKSRYSPFREEFSRGCDIDGCDKPHNAKGLCYRHYLRFKAGVTSPEVDNKRYLGRNCFITGCPNEAGGRMGMCKSHTNWAGKYAFSVAQAVHILNSGFGCDICDAPIGRFDINVDHDHDCCPGQGTCGECVRGLLCRGCNRAIGSFGEDAARVLSAYNYLTGN